MFSLNKLNLFPNLFEQNEPVVFFTPINKMRLAVVPITMLFVFAAIGLFAQAEKKQSVIFHTVLGNSALQLTDPFYKNINGDSITIELLKFYISGLELLQNDSSVFKEKNSFHLIDAAKIISSFISFTTPAAILFNKIKFNIGIDSSTNVSGAMGGDLDPLIGMYWAWQSGYINFKLEGKSNRCNTRNHAFQFHLGGYSYPFNALQTVILNVTAKDEIVITTDIEKLIAGIDLSSQNQVMSPGKEAVLLSEKLKNIFSTVQQ